MRSSASSTSKPGPGPSERQSEAGNATVGFVGTVGLLVALLYTLLSISLAWHVEAILRDSASEGARAAALDGAALSDATVRTRELITTTLPSQYADSVVAAYDAGDVVVTVRAQLPLPPLFVTSTEVVVRVARE